MRLREHEGIKEGKLDMLRADPRHLIVQEGYNVRDLTTPDAVEKLKELAASIAEVGVKDPLLVRFDAEGEKIIVVEGHRRLAATLMAIEGGADIRSVPIYAEAQKTNDAQRDLGLIISNSGEPLTQMERATVVGRLVAHGWTHDEIRKKCGWKSNATVTGYLDMLAMPAELQQHVKNGIVAATMARRLEAEEPGKAAKIIADAAEEQRRLGKKGRATPKAIAKATGKKPSDKLQVPSQRMNRAEASETETQAPASGVASEPAAPEAAAPASTTTAATAEDHTLQQQRDIDASEDAARKAVRDLIEALAPFAGYVEQYKLKTRGDDELELIEVPVRDLKRAALVYARATGWVG